MPKPKAVLISDVHYNINTLPLADAAMRQAISKANSLNVSLIVAGDLHDTKAMLRGECVKAIVETFKLCAVQPTVIAGNHDLFNEKSKEHSLEFLKPYAHVVGDWEIDVTYGLYLFPYYSDPKALEETLTNNVPEGSTVILHQGVSNSNSGHYIQDHTALPKEVFANYRCISGHYHAAQDLQCGKIRKNKVGLFSYIGNPYTLNFAEVKDPAKGFAVLYDDGTLERMPTNLRSHVIVEYSIEQLKQLERIHTFPEDLIWLKVTGSHSELQDLDKKTIAKQYMGRSDFKLDLIYTDDPKSVDIDQKANLTKSDLFDSIIDETKDTDEYRQRLKSLYRNLLSEDPKCRGQ